jgi:hypothetical protein
VPSATGFEVIATGQGVSKPVGQGVSKRVRSENGLRFRGVFKLKIGKRGRELLRGGDLDGRIQIVVRRGNEELRPPVKLVPLRKIRSGK